ncbi:cytochrome P450-dit2 [Basidiobolus ranarum]|uniref:Cytochrome P450-dit2 n=1 Tax=Basidiobolus ranarum TaxID=34480 RepID=A0ABR2X5C9_9FUNG
MELFYIALAALSVIFVKYRWCRTSFSKEFQNLPKTKDLYAVFQMLLGRDIVDVFDSCYIPSLREDGIARSYFKGQSGVMISNQEYYLYIMRNTETFPKLSYTAAPHTLISHFLGYNVVSANGKDWKVRRDMMSPLLRAGWEPANVGEIIYGFLNHLSTVDSVPDIFHTMQLLTLDILGKVLFGINFEAINRPNNEHVALYNTASNAAFNVMYLAFPILDHFPFGKRFKERQAIADLPWMNKTLTFEDMISEMVTLISAGHDTTASALSSVMYILAKYPEIQTKVREEAESEFKFDPSSLEIPSMAQLQSLKYLEAVIKEAMRIYVPIPLIPTRIAAQDTLLGKVVIPKNSLITLNIYAMHRDEKYWPDPTKFDPTR